MTFLLLWNGAFLGPLCIEISRLTPSHFPFAFGAAQTGKISSKSYKWKAISGPSLVDLTRDDLWLFQFRRNPVAAWCIVEFVPSPPSRTLFTAAGSGSGITSKFGEPSLILALLRQQPTVFWYSANVYGWSLIYLLHNLYTIIEDHCGSRQR